MSKFKRISLALAYVALFSACGRSASALTPYTVLMPNQSASNTETVSSQPSRLTALASPSKTLMIEEDTWRVHKSFSITQGLTRCMEKIKRIR
ncbi:hypothetical protein ACPV4A_08155 [Vibrio rotiferianus]